MKIIYTLTIIRMPCTQLDRNLNLQVVQVSLISQPQKPLMYILYLIRPKLNTPCTLLQGKMKKMPTLLKALAKNSNLKSCKHTVQRLTIVTWNRTLLQTCPITKTLMNTTTACFGPQGPQHEQFTNPMYEENICQQASDDSSHDANVHVHEVRNPPNAEEHQEPVNRPDPQQASEDTRPDSDVHKVRNPPNVEELHATDILHTQSSLSKTSGAA
ncbi:hypothetical protein Bbelb_073180 [Branchiostoma belcheri]|nr:hypothetical protein Bbelb_073180 [Branchiostoma belcheri]